MFLSPNKVISVSTKEYWTPSSFLELRKNVTIQIRSVKYLLIWDRSRSLSLPWTCSACQNEEEQKRKGKKPPGLGTRDATITSSFTVSVLWVPFFDLHAVAGHNNLLDLAILLWLRLLIIRYLPTLHD